MSNIAQNLQKLNTDKNNICNSLVVKGIENAQEHGFDDFANDILNIDNQYSLEDEGKVVSNGQLTSQTSLNITENGEYDTTLNNSISVNVSSNNEKQELFLSKSIDGYVPGQDNSTTAYSVYLQRTKNFENIIYMISCYSSTYKLHSDSSTTYYNRYFLLGSDISKLSTLHIWGIIRSNNYCNVAYNLMMCAFDSNYTFSSQTNLLLKDYVYIDSEYHWGSSSGMGTYPYKVSVSHTLSCASYETFIQNHLDDVIGFGFNIKGSIQSYSYSSDYFNVALSARTDNGKTSPTYYGPYNYIWT